MIVFKDQSYCASDCVNTACVRNKQQHDEARKALKHLKDLPTGWADFSQSCDDYLAPPPEAA